MTFHQSFFKFFHSLSPIPWHSFLLRIRKTLTRTHAIVPLVAVVAFVFYSSPTGTQERYSSTWFGHIHPHNVRFIHFQHPPPSLQMLCNLSHPKVPSVFSLFLQISEYRSCSQDVTLNITHKRTKGLQIDGRLIVAKHLN